MSLAPSPYWRAWTSCLFAAIDPPNLHISSRRGRPTSSPLFCEWQDAICLPSGARTRQTIEGCNSCTPRTVIEATAVTLKKALEEVRSRGFPMAVDEMEDGTLSVEVPLREQRGR